MKLNSIRDSGLDILTGAYSLLLKLSLNKNHQYYILFSGIPELDFKVNRERQQTLIIKRRMFNGSDGRARSNATEGKAFAPTLTKYTYWTPKVRETILS